MSSCSSCRHSLMGKRYVLKDEIPTCIACYESKYANTCNKCMKVIGTESKDVTYKDKHFHDGCFLCASCHKPLANTQFITQGTSLVCEPCYNQNYAESCDKCQRIFKHGMEKVDYNGKKYHVDCFTCMSCKKPIGNNTFMPMDSKFMCMNCYNDNYASQCGGCSKA